MSLTAGTTLTMALNTKIRAHNDKLKLQRLKQVRKDVESACTVHDDLELLEVDLACLIVLIYR